ncbi:iron ABC transporter permease [Blautia coccoides]|uniref:ABC transporter permease n=1 Tax=Blautia producta TaxID=33035 RepID=UPI00214A2EEE|nr:iron ABC transporter permease [Blautia coccoides]
MKKFSDKRAVTIYFTLFVLLFVLIILPIVSVFSEAVIVDGRLDLKTAFLTVLSKGNVTTITNSLILGILVVLVSTFISTPLAFLLARTRFSKFKWLDIVLMIPFMTPPYISSMGWILFMQKRGLFQQLFPYTGSLSEQFFSLGGLVMAMSFHVFPFMTTMIKNAILNIGMNLEESAAVGGASFIYRMKKVMLPLLTGNYAIAILLVFVKTLSEYGTPSTIGNRIGFYVFTTDIHRYASTSPIDFGKASSLSSILVLICMIMWWIQNNTTSKHTYNLLGGKGKRESMYMCSKLTETLGGLYIFVIIILSIGIPYFSVIATSLIKLRGYGLAAGNFTFSHYVELFTKNNKGWEAMTTSLYLAVASATIASIIGTLLVVLIRKAKKWKKLIEVEALLPEMLPNIVLVIGMMLFWNKIYKWIPLYNTLGFMVLVYVIMFLPYSVQYVSSSLMQTGDSLLEAGKICGGGRRYVFLHVTLPLIKGGVLQGWMMIFIIVFRELVGASLISPPNVQTVSTFIVREFEQGSASVAMAMALICVLLTTTLLIILNQVTARKKY